MIADLGNVLVLTIFALSMVAVIIGYLLAWRSGRSHSRRIGALIVAGVAGLAGLFMSAYLMGAVMPLPPPDGESVWGVLGFLFVFSPLPLAAFYICAKFIRRAFSNQATSNSNDVVSTPSYPNYRSASATILIICIANVLAWWWGRSGIVTGIDRVDLWLDYISLMLTIPGWFIVSSFDKSQAQLATRLTDILIPILSGLIWGLTTLMVLDLLKTLRKFNKARSIRPE